MTFPVFLVIASLVWPTMVWPLGKSYSTFINLTNENSAQILVQQGKHLARSNG